MLLTEIVNQYLMEHGTTVNRVKPVFPTEDFPVWTSFATGRYPEDHGITGDMMYNLRTKVSYKFLQLVELFLKSGCALFFMVHLNGFTRSKVEQRKSNQFQNYFEFRKE